MSRFRPLVIFLSGLMIAAALLTSGCGNKGPLYLPDDRPDQQN